MLCLILDEAHLYRGANGTEVAYLIRRLLDRLGLPASRVVFIATSASFSNGEAAAKFVARLTSLEPEAITTLTGSKRAFEPAAPGPNSLAKAFAAVPLNSLQSSPPRDRAAVLKPIAAHTPTAGVPVTLTRTDGSAIDIIVTVHGVDGCGNAIAEEVLLGAGGSAQTEQDYLVVNDVQTSECDADGGGTARRRSR